MKKTFVRIAAAAALLLTAILLPQDIQAAAKWTRVRMEFTTNYTEQTSTRIKYGNKYYYAKRQADSIHMGEGDWADVIDYYVSDTKKGEGKKLFTNYEATYDLNARLEFYTNGKYILQTRTNTSDKTISICRYNMNGKKKKTLRTFKIGTSSSEGEGYSASCAVEILTVYGNTVYAAYQRTGVDGSYVNIVSFSIKNKKAPVTVAHVPCYFTTTDSRYIGWSENHGSTTLYDCKKGASKTIASTQITYIGTYKSKMYFRAINAEDLTIYRLNSGAKKVKKVKKFKNCYEYAYMSGKSIYFDGESDIYYVYNVANGKKKKSTWEKYRNAGTNSDKKFKTRAIWLS